MTARHARRSRIPFSLLVILLVVLAGGLWFFVRDPVGPWRHAAESGAGAASPIGGGSWTDPTGAAQGSGAPQVTPGTADDAGTEPAGASGGITGSKGKLVIHGTGDVSLDPSYIPAFRSNGYAWAWTGLEGLFRDDDLTVINLECPATDISAPIPKEFNFRCDPAALPVAKRFGVDVANQSNNHAYDQGAGGLLDSLKQIRKAGLAPVGAGANQGDALRAAYVDLKGWKVATVGIDEVLDPIDEVAGPDKPGTAAGHDFGLALRAIREAAAKADLVVVAIHWGVELDTQPREYQVAEAHQMIDAGADVIFGAHAHRLQPLEVYRGKPIFYGLGNFVWPHFSVEGSTTAVAQAVVHPDGRITATLLPAYIVSDGHPVLR